MPLKQVYRQLKRATDVRFGRGGETASTATGAGAAGDARPAAAVGAARQFEVRLEPAALDFSAVQFAMLPTDPAADGAGESSLGYIRILTFTETVPEEVAAAVSELTQRRGASRLLLDLRDDPGGLVSAGEPLRVQGV